MPILYLPCTTFRALKFSFLLLDSWSPAYTFVRTWHFIYVMVGDFPKMKTFLERSRITDSADVSALALWDYTNHALAPRENVIKEMVEIANFAGTFVLTLFALKKKRRWGEKGCYAGGKCETWNYFLDRIRLRGKRERTAMGWMEGKAPYIQEKGDHFHSVWRRNASRWDEIVM